MVGRGASGFYDRSGPPNDLQDRPTHHGAAMNAGSKRSKKSSNFNKNDFALSIPAIMNGTETRTTLMIRNIPNKYTQCSVLEEINVNHSGLYDFFYLPIDFKNRCNVGYAFINFIDARDVAAFFEEFSGSRWKNFNSEKICAVTFARIQGKASMITRFQNSSLLEKDDEYRPLLFSSSGPNKGRPEPFPLGSRSAATRKIDEEHRQQDGVREAQPPPAWPVSTAAISTADDRPIPVFQDE